MVVNIANFLLLFILLAFRISIRLLLLFTSFFDLFQFLLLRALNENRPIVLLLHVNHSVDKKLDKLSVLDIFWSPFGLIKFEINIEDAFNPVCRFEIRAHKHSFAFYFIDRRVIFRVHAQKRWFNFIFNSLVYEELFYFFLINTLIHKSNEWIHQILRV